MCCCVVAYGCNHRVYNVKPYHCKCEKRTLANKEFARPCDNCRHLAQEIEEEEVQELIRKNKIYFPRELETTVELRLTPTNNRGSALGPRAREFGPEEES